jgi:hypothetical protein
MITRLMVSAMADQERTAHFAESWGRIAAPSDLIDLAVAMVTAPVSAEAAAEADACDFAPAASAGPAPAAAPAPAPTGPDHGAAAARVAAYRTRTGRSSRPTAEEPV